MTDLEIQINEFIKPKENSETKAAISASVKKALTTSSTVVKEAGSKIGNSLGECLQEATGKSLLGSLAGKAGKSAVKLVGGAGAGVVSGVLSVAASFIPGDNSDLEDTATDHEIAALIDRYTLSIDVDSLLELVVYLHTQGYNASCWGEETSMAFKNKHKQAYNSLKALNSDDPKVKVALSQFQPKKRFGLF